MKRKLRKDDADDQDSQVLHNYARKDLVPRIFDADAMLACDFVVFLGWWSLPVSIN